MTTMNTGAPMVFASSRTDDLRGSSSGVNGSTATVKRLLESITQSWKDERRKRMLGEYYNARRLWSGPLADLHAWPYNGETGDPNFAPASSAPVNVMHQTIAALEANILSNDPTVQIKPRFLSSYRRFGQIVAAHAQRRLHEMRYIEEERMCFKDALMGMGVMKVGEYGAGYSFEWFGARIEPGQRYICRVSPSDYCISRQARDRMEAEWECERYRTTTDRLMGVLTPEEIDRLPKTSERPDKRDRGQNTDFDAFVQFHDLIDIWVPPGVLSREALTLTVAGTPDGFSSIGYAVDRYLIRDPREWEGPASGPYEVYGFNRIQDTPYYAAPTVVLRDMAQMIGDLSRHIIESDQTAADLIVHRDSVNPDEKSAIRSAKHLDMIAVEDPGAYTQIQRGGSTERAQGSLSMHLQLYGQMSGSGLLSATGIQKKSGDTTATEAEEVSARLNVLLDGMERRVYEHADRVLEKFVWYEFRDPLLNNQVNLKTGGVEVAYVVTAGQMDLYGLHEINLEVRRGSMRRVNEQSRIKRLMEWASGPVPIGVQIKQAFGDGFDIMAWLRLTSDGLIEPADVDELIPDPNSLSLAIAKMAAAGGIDLDQAAGGGQGGQPGPKRKPGTPGSSAISGSSQTGNRGSGFDKGAIAENTVSGMGFGGM